MLWKLCCTYKESFNISYFNFWDFWLCMFDSTFFLISLWREVIAQKITECKFSNKRLTRYLTQVNSKQFQIIRSKGLTILTLLAYFRYEKKPELNRLFQCFVLSQLNLHHYKNYTYLKPHYLPNHPITYK